jgi:uncharacterized protein YmfQ (DUF2313 family)
LEFARQSARYRRPSYSIASFQADAFDSNGFPTIGRTGTVIYRFFAAIGAVRNYLESRLCDLRLEFWCASETETNDQWMQEYGLPDACDPYPDLCAKVAAIGGGRCEYFQSIVARFGWAITCLDGGLDCGSRVGNARAGRARVGSYNHGANLLAIFVNTGASPAYVTPITQTPRTGRLRAGQRMSCTTPDLSPLRCVLDRIVPAHLTIQYLTV